MRLSRGIFLLCSLFAITLIYWGCAEKPVQPNYNLIQSSSLSFQEQDFDIVHFKTGKVKLKLFWKNQKKDSPFNTFENLKDYLLEQDQDLLFATNAGIFSNDFTPGGLHVENSQEISALNMNDGAGNFHMMPNGVFMLTEEGPKVIETKEYSNVKNTPILATQSGPMLVINRKIHPTFTEGSSNKYIRNGVGVTEDGEIFFAISRKPVNFYDFARLFKEELNCPNALYLDGAISKFYAPSLGLTEGQGKFVGILGAVSATSAEAPN